jgi:hypothetical protein
MGHIVHSSASRLTNIDVLFFLFGCTRHIFHKKHVGMCYAEHLLLPSVGFVGHIVHFGASIRKMSMHYFTCSGGPGEVSIKSAPGHVTSKLCFCI